MAPIAERNKVVLISPSASTPKLTAAGDYIFRNELSDAYGGLAQANLTWTKLEIESVAVLFINNDYGLGVKDAFVKSFENHGGNITETKSFAPNSKDFRTQLLQIKNSAPKGIFLVA